MKNRKVDNIINGTQTSDGAGVKLRRIIGGSEISMLDPFLLFDDFGSDNADDYIAGFPSHPHRGFETITYMISGKFRHKDSAGNEGFLSDGSVQWMTAGKGVIHSEMPEKTNGKVKGFQLWLNLPKSLKMIEPSYNDISSSEIPIVNLSNGTLRVISGSFQNIKGPGNPHTGMLYFDLNLNPNSNNNIKLEDNWNTFLYVYEGTAEIGGRQINNGQMAVLSNKGDLSIRSLNSYLKCVIISGEPINESVARGGPFVMNTRAEILQAFQDYEEGVLTK